MANKRNQILPMELDGSWIGDEPLDTTSVYAYQENVELRFTDEDWKMYLPMRNIRICSSYLKNMISIYAVVFKEMGPCHPF